MNNDGIVYSRTIVNYNSPLWNKSFVFPSRAGLRIFHFSLFIIHWKNMFLLFTLVLLVVAVGIMFSVYSTFFPFMQNLGTVSQYHMAYYGAISAVERAELSLKYRSPGFEGSGGFFWTTGFGPISDYTPELLSGATQWLWWTITSRTTSIPSSGMGNTDLMLSNPDSKNYNMLGYTYVEKISLWYDATTNSELYYTWWGAISFFSGSIVTGEFRLPPKVYAAFWWAPSASLCDSSLGDCDPDGDGIYDDVAVSWSLEGIYQESEFTISPTISVFEYTGGMQVDTYSDNAIRESIVNDSWGISFSSEPPFSPVANGTELTYHNVTGIQADVIQSLGFSNIFTDTTHFSDLFLSFGAANFFRTFTDALYPYLEYRLSFPQEIADRDYSIVGHGRVGDYDVQISLKKPTSQEALGWDFSVTF